MDEVKIRTPFMRGILGKLLSKFISKKIGKKIDIKLNHVAVENYENGLKFDIAVVGTMEKDEFAALLKDLI